MQEQDLAWKNLRSGEAKRSFWPFFTYVASLCCFIGAYFMPLLETDVFLGLKHRQAYLWDSVAYFYEEGDYFIGSLLLLCCLVFPSLKYAYLAWVYYGGRAVARVMDILTKWAMLDVFVLALVVVNLKLGQGLVLRTSLGWGGYLLALAVVLLMFLPKSFGLEAKEDKEE